MECLSEMTRFVQNPLTEDRPRRIGAIISGRIRELDAHFGAALVTTVLAMSVRSVCAWTALRLTRTGSSARPFLVNHFPERGSGGHDRHVGEKLLPGGSKDK